MPHLTFRFARLWLPLLGALVLAGCTDGDRARTAAEVDEPSYREGQALLKTGRRQEALSAFLKVIDKRGEDAPESHLEIGLLYAQHINDPLSAIYHFKKYLALRPNSPQAPLIRQRIDAATREFARMLPAQPLESQLQRVDLVATLDKLKQENEALKQQLADARSGRNTVALPGVEAGPTAVVTNPDPAPAAPGFNFSVDPVPAVRPRQAPPTRAATATPTRPTPAVTPPVAPANRRHTIQPGDTLYKIAQRYYGDSSRWREIYAANRNVMKSDTDLKAGVMLRIP